LRAPRQYYGPIRHPGAYDHISRSRLWPSSPRRAFFAGHRGLLQFPHHPSHHVAADPPPVRVAASDSFRPAPAAFARYRPSQPPEFRVTRLRLRSLYVATWCVAHTPFRVCCRRAPPSCFRATAPPQLRGLGLLASVGLAPTGQCVLDWTRRSASVACTAPRSWPGTTRGCSLRTPTPALAPRRRTQCGGKSIPRPLVPAGRKRSLRHATPRGGEGVHASPQPHSRRSPSGGSRSAPFAGSASRTTDNPCSHDRSPGLSRG